MISKDKELQLLGILVWRRILLFLINRFRTHKITVLHHSCSISNYNALLIHHKNNDKEITISSTSYTAVHIRSSSSLNQRFPMFFHKTLLAMRNYLARNNNLICSRKPIRIILLLLLKTNTMLGEIFPAATIVNQGKSSYTMHKPINTFTFSIIIITAIATVETNLLRKHNPRVALKILQLTLRIRTLLVLRETHIFNYLHMLKNNLLGKKMQTPQCLEIIIYLIPLESSVKHQTRVTNKAITMTNNNNNNNNKTCSQQVSNSIKNQV